MVGYYAIAPYFFGMALILAFVSTPIFKWADTPPSASGKRISAIDGLRGFLALAVFFHHGTIYDEWLLNQVWQAPPSRFYTQLGQSGVAFFFMITGYLFWERTLRFNGRLSLRELYIGRIFRVGPLYLFAVGVMLGIIFWQTGFAARVPESQLLNQVALWSALGFFGDGPDVNGYAHSSILLAGVTWSLQYEWWFYISLSVTCYLARSGAFHYVIILPLVVLIIALSTNHFLILTPCGYLIVGMLCASLEKDGRVLKISDSASSCAIVALLLADFALFETAYAVGPMLIMGLCFYLAVCGSKFYGLLVSRPAIRLGNISYGTYLLQGLVLYGVFSIYGVKNLALASSAADWVILFVCACLLVVAATFAHILIERPGIELGKALARRLARNGKGLRPALTS